MTRPQRILVIAGLLLIATLLHTLLCEWSFKLDTGTAGAILVYRHESGRMSTRHGIPTSWITSGLFAQPRDSRNMSIVCGVALPLFLLGMPRGSTASPSCFKAIPPW